MRARILILLALPAAIGAASATSAATTPRCHTGDLAGAIIDENAGAGQRQARLILTNTSGRACHTQGDIGGQLVSASGASLPTTLVRDSATPHRVTLQPGAAGSVRLHWTVIAGGSQGCAKARTLRVTPPDETTQLSVFFGDTACGGRIDVGPVRGARRG